MMNDLYRRGYYIEGGVFMQPYPYYYNTPQFPNNRVPVSNILNVEATPLLLLKLKLYNVDNSKDVDITLEQGKTYHLKYITERGPVECVGKLAYINIDSPIGQTVQFVGIHNHITDFAHLTFDCSTVESSDVRQVLINSIRDIEEVTE